MTTLDKVRLLKSYYEQGKIKTLQIHEVNPGLPKENRLNYIYFTLPVSLNFQRSSPAMWASALKTYNDPETNYLFYPEKVVLEDPDKIKLDLLKHKLALQPNKHSYIWYKLSQTLNKYFENDPKNILASSDFDVSKILDLVRIKHKKDFPYLSGTKISNYWLFILLKFTDLKLNNVSEISVIPDTHVIKSSIKLGLATEKTKPEEIVQIWKDLLTGSEIIPLEMHSVLWNWSRDNFRPEV